MYKRQGEEAKQLFDRVFAIISTHTDIKSKIIYNRLNRVKMMLSLVKSFDNLILTKFVNKVWRRYGFFSHLGEMFLTLDELIHYLPEFEKKREAITLSRTSTFEDDDIESSSETDDDDTEEESSNEEDKADDKKAKKSKAKKK